MYHKAPSGGLISISTEKTAAEEPYELDEEWVRLITSARRLGFTPDEIRTFLRTHSFVDVRNAVTSETY